MIISCLFVSCGWRSSTEVAGWIVSDRSSRRLRRRRHRATCPSDGGVPSAAFPATGRPLPLRSLPRSSHPREGPPHRSLSPLSRSYGLLLGGLHARLKAFYPKCPPKSRHSRSHCGSCAGRSGRDATDVSASGAQPAGSVDRPGPSRAFSGRPVARPA
jgi:hypothetical protein